MFHCLYDHYTTAIKKYQLIFSKLAHQTQISGKIKKPPPGAADTHGGRLKENITTAMAGLRLIFYCRVKNTPLPLTKAYMETLLCFSPFFLLNNILIAFVRNDNNPKLAMTAMVTGSFSNIALDYIFIFPLSMGMFGAALATGFSLILSVCVLSLHFWTKRNQFSLQKCKMKIKKLTNILHLGFSARSKAFTF